MVAEAPPIGELEARRPFPARLGPKGNLIYKLVTTTDHKLIGIMYCVACFIFFFIGGLMALFMRTELALPGPAVPVQRAVQPAVHHARHGDAAVLRDARSCSASRTWCCRCRSARPTWRSRG